MEDQEQLISASDNQSLMRRGILCLGAGLICLPVMAMGACSYRVSAGQMLAYIRLGGLAALLAFPAATLSGVRFLRRYRLCRRYFKATGLTKARMRSIQSWKETGDVTR